jgi:UDP-N-acetylglucosamine 2-epimerase (non-hydrolysing)
MTELSVFFGTRPNVPKIWTMQRGLRLAAQRQGNDRLRWATVHSGQHYDAKLGTDLCAELGLTVDRWLAPESWRSDGEQIAALLKVVEVDVLAHPPAGMVIVGDVNTTLAAGLVGARHRIPVIHLEAGLRSEARTGEEVNRRIITSCAQFHLATTHRAAANLVAEGVAPARIWVVGNPMAECYRHHGDRTDDGAVLTRLGLSEGEYVLATVHKQDTLADSAEPLRLIEAAARACPVVFPCHPTTRRHLARAGLAVQDSAALKVIEPQAYVAFGALLRGARAVITDSDGVQEEASVAGVPCLSLVEATARPEIMDDGGHRTLSQWAADPAAAVDALNGRRGGSPPLWDSLVSARLAEAIGEVVDQLPSAFEQPDGLADNGIDTAAVRTPVPA